MSRAELVEVFPQVTVPVASLGDLIAMKILARDDLTRPQDRLDLKALLGRAKSHDKQTARLALEQISSSGYSRGRQLTNELSAAEREFAEAGPPQ